MVVGSASLVALLWRKSLVEEIKGISGVVMLVGKPTSPVVTDRDGKVVGISGSDSDGLRPVLWRSGADTDVILSVA